MPKSERATEMHSEEAIAQVMLPHKLCHQVNTGNISMSLVSVTKHVRVWNIQCCNLFFKVHSNSQLKHAEISAGKLKLVKTDLWCKLFHFIPFTGWFLNPYSFSTKSQSCQCLHSHFRATAPVISLNSHKFNKHPIPAVSNDNGNNCSPFDLLPSHDPTLTFRLTESVSRGASGFWLQTCLVPSHAQNSVQKMPDPVKLLKKYLQARPR